MKTKQAILTLCLLFLGACSGAVTDEEGSSNATTPSVSSVPNTETPGSREPSETPSFPKPTAMAPGNYDKTILIGTDQRSYILHVPTNYDGSKALPLLYILHGGGGKAEGMEKLTGMSARADQDDFFVAYLQSATNNDGKNVWNSGLLTEDVTADDVAFVRNLTQDLKAQLKVDDKRIYAAGFSNGASMVHRLGSELSDILAGIAAVTGTIGKSLDGGATFETIPAAQGPISVVLIHGLQDDIAPYYGGQVGNSGTYVAPVSAAVDFWTTANACMGSPLTWASPNHNVITKDYKGCAQGTEVELLTIVNGEHEWPSFQGHTGFSATDSILDFFSRHSRN